MLSFVSDTEQKSTPLLRNSDSQSFGVTTGKKISSEFSARVLAFQSSF